MLLAGDIDRGGVFAQLYGTVKLLTDDEQKRIAGLIVNKFRGDIDILAPGLKMVEEKTGIPVLGVIPYIRVDIDDEDSLAPRLNAKSEVKPLDIAIIRIPRMSNFTDFAPLEAHEVIGARYVQSAEELHNPDMVIIPGTKSTMDEPSLDASKRHRISNSKACKLWNTCARSLRWLSDDGRKAFRPTSYRGRP